MIDIFIAYSHHDLSYKNELKKFLRPLFREERISMWDDFDIEAGQDWDAKIKERLYGADLVLLLVSADSLASDYFYGKEVKVSLERHARGEAVVVPVILRHCDWEETPLGSLEALPEKGRPVVDWPTRDQAFQDVVSRLRRVVHSLEQRRQTATMQAEALRQFQAACLAADHLLQKQNWTEARTAYTFALAAHRPGFSPDPAVLQARQADCEVRLHEEQLAENERISQEEAIRVTEAQRAKEAKAAEVRRAREAEVQRQRAEKERLAPSSYVSPNSAGEEARERRMATATTPSNSWPRWLLPGIGVVLLALLLLWAAWSWRNDVGPVGQPQQNSLSTKEPSGPPSISPQKNTETALPSDSSSDQKAFEQAQRLGTVTAWKQFLTQVDDKNQKQAAEKQLKDLEQQVAALLKEANTYVRLDEPSRAKELLQNVLKIDPDNVTAKAKLKTLK